MNITSTFVVQASVPFGASLVLIILACSKVYWVFAYKTKGIKIQGECVDVEENIVNNVRQVSDGGITKIGSSVGRSSSVRYHPVISYIAPDGAHKQFTSKRGVTSYDSYRVGQKVSIVYIEGLLDEAIIDSSYRDIGDAALYLIFSVFLGYIVYMLYLL
jgi:hypothetical protein